MPDKLLRGLLPAALTGAVLGAISAASEYDRSVPIYDFKCRACGNVFDELVKLGETPDCPSCGSKDLERLVSLPAVSTEASRKRSLGKARERAKKVNQEKQHAQAEYERNYIKDHS